MFTERPTHYDDGDGADDNCDGTDDDDDGELLLSSVQLHEGTRALPFSGAITRYDSVATMTSQGVVERASAELSKRINGLTLRAANKPSSGGSTAGGATGSPSRAPRTGTSVMERVTNVLCGGGGGGSSSLGSGGGGSGGGGSGGSGGGIQYPRFRGRTPVRNRAAAYRVKRPVTWPELMRDEQFLNGFFTYFSAAERVPLARVCVRWRDVLYRSPKFWHNVRPVIRCKQLRSYNYADKAAVFKSFVAREMTAVTIYGALDQDTVEFVNTYPFPNKNILSLCLQSSSVTDRGLESFLDHLQASKK